ncbi:MAG: DUF6240 domain-containing protein [Lachnospiraceae bacterium]|nr:DUF6240 domain-containing protein [Lachnospiraceae bacterium]
MNLRISENIKNNEIPFQTEEAAKKSEKHAVKKGGFISPEGTILSAEKTGNAVYERPGTSGASVADVMAAAENKDAVQMKNEMIFSAKTITSDSDVLAKEEGTDVLESDIHEVATVTDKIHAKLAAAGKDVSYFTDELSAEDLERAGIEGGLAQSAIKYMMTNELLPTSENIYKATFASASVAVTPAAQTAQDIKGSAYEEQLKTAIAEAGLPENDKNVDNALFLLENEIPATPENLAEYDNLANLSEPKTREEIIDEKADDCLDTIENVTDDEILYVLSKGEEVTLANLKKAKNAIASGRRAPEGFVPDELKFIHAKRMVEETRLVMTAEANKSLLAKGISLDTKPIEQVVNDLKNMEISYYENLLNDGKTAISKDELSVKAKLFADVISIAEELKSVPSFTLGAVKEDATVSEIHDEGLSLKRKLAEAGETYDTLRTEVRRELGDSIKKAFTNVDNILEDLNLPVNEANERAVRILGYNSREITPESIASMKVFDAKVQNAFNALKPATVKEFISRGLNPLDMDIETLNKTADSINAENSADKEITKVGEYLWKLEHTGSISPEERDSYIGIFRLINQVNASDGAAVGALVEQGAEITMRNLLHAVKSAKKGKVDYKVSDDFGGVDGISKGKTILEQINAVYEIECVKAVASTDFDPSRFRELVKDEKYFDMVPSDILNALINEEPELEYEAKELFEERKLQIEEAVRAEDTVYNLLWSTGEAVSVVNVNAATNLLSNPKDAMKQLFNIEKIADTVGESDEVAELLEEIAKIKEDILAKFADSLDNPEELVKAQETLYEVAAHCTQTFMYEGMSTLDLKQLQTMTKQLSVATGFSLNEFYNIPAVVGGEICNIRLKVDHQSENKGLISIAMDTDGVGLASELKIQENAVRGYIAFDSRAKADEVSAKADALIKELSSEKTEVDIRIVYQGDLDTAAFMKNVLKKSLAAEEKAENKTATLYGYAEKVISFISEI